MQTSITIQLDEKLQRAIDEVAKQTGRSREDIALDALGRHLWLARFEQARRRLAPFAEAQGYLTDEDVFRDVS